MTITPDQAQKLLDSGTPGPWHKCRDNHSDCDCSEDTVFGPDVIGSENPGIWWTTADETVILSAPDLAETIAGMTEEWGVQHGTTVICLDFYGTEDEESGHIRWTPDRPRAEAWKKTMEDCFPGETYRLVRRPVGSAVVVDGE